MSNHIAFVFIGGVLVGLIISIFTLKMIYKEAMKKMSEEFSKVVKNLNGEIKELKGK